MKRMIKFCGVLIVLLSFCINVSAVTITTDSNVSGTVDTNSKYITNTGTVSVTGVQSVDTFKAYRILKGYFNSSS